MDQQPPSADKNVMGVIRWAYENYGQRSFTTYKKRFFIINDKEDRLEMYKNDQETFPLVTYPAHEFRGVFFFGEKHDKFYSLELGLRRGDRVKFRLNSLEERDRLSEAITRLIERHSTFSHNQNVLRAVRRRMLAAERSLGVSITLTVAPMTSIPEKFLQYVVEAVDAAIRTASAVLRAFGDDANAPRRFIITLSAADALTRPDPQYDPMTRSLSFGVAIYCDSFNHVCFHVTDPVEIMAMTQSHVWRDPLIEGWITSNPGCVAVCREISNLLGLKKNFEFTFQWGQSLRDTRDIEAYLEQFVNEGFLRQVMAQIQSVIDEFHSTEPIGDDVSTYIKYLGDYVQSIAIEVDEVAVKAARPPRLSVTPTEESQRRCRHAALFIAQFHDAFPQKRVAAPTLRDRLVEVILLADLAKQLSESKALLRQAFGGKKHVKVVWDNLLRVCSSIHVQLQYRNLGRLVVALTQIYVDRLETMRQLISGIDAPHEEERPFFNVFKNVKSIFVDFVPFTSAGKPLPDFKLCHGVLTDFFLCCTGELGPALVDVIRRQRLMPQLPSKTYTVVENLFVFPSIPAPLFKEWCEDMAVSPPNGSIRIINSNDDDKSNNNVGEEDHDDDASSWSTSQGDMYGNAVAFERIAETQVLDIHRVVSMVYDSQGPAVNLKIGADAIRESIVSLELEFDGQSIRKHDLVRILTANLRRLRAMYSYTVGGEVLNAPEFSSAVQLLQEYCEYEASEEGIPALLQQSAAMRRQASPVTICVPGDFPLASNHLNSPTNLPTPAQGCVYDFQCISRVALNYLLPREAKVARRAWRVGFIAGLENVGKTLILNTIKGIVQSTVPTVGLSRCVMAFEEWVFAMNELGGRESFRENWKYYVDRMEAVDYVVFVIDAMNKSTYKDAAAYLRGVATYFKTIPLLVIFNHYTSNSPGTPSQQSLMEGLGIDKIQRKYPNRRVFVGTCDITVARLVDRTVPTTLMDALKELSSYLREVSSPERQAEKPKAGKCVETVLRFSSSMASQR